MQGASREWGGWGQEKRRRKVCRGPVGSGGDGVRRRGGGKYGRGRRDAGGQVGREGGKADNHMGGRGREPCGRARPLSANSAVPEKPDLIEVELQSA